MSNSGFLNEADIVYRQELETTLNKDPQFLDEMGAEHVYAVRLDRLLADPEAAAVKRNYLARALMKIGMGPNNPEDPTPAEVDDLNLKLIGKISVKPASEETIN